MFRACLAAAGLLASALATAVSVPGTGTLEGRVQARGTLRGATVYALDEARHVGYMVYVVGGRYRANNVFPGDYTVTVRHAGFAPASATVHVGAGASAVANFSLAAVPVQPDYVGGMVYPDAKIEPYDVIYPPGPGRDVMERTCMGCHTVQFFPYNVVRQYPTGRTPKDRAAWETTVDRMSKGNAFGTPGKPSYFDAALLSAKDREVLIDYLATNFPRDAPPRVVRKEGGDPPLDDRALAKAEFVEYRFPNTKEMPQRFTQQIDFDRDGNVWVTDRGAPALVKVDPRTGERTDYVGHGGGHGLAVDADGTVWYSGEVVRRFDPKADKHDSYVLEGDRRVGSNTQIFDSKGNLWLSLLTTGGLGVWDRKTDTIRQWDVPIERSRPYGIIVDHHDRVWWAGYHDSGVDRFDPATGEFKHFPVTSFQPTNIRRPGVDSKDRIWVATWGSKGMQNGALYRVDPDTGKVLERKLGIPYANPYTVEVDEFDRVWVATDNYLVMYDQVRDRFTYYPLPTRTDVPKLTIARGGAIWFTPRNAGQSGDYGGAASVLLPDMDRVESFKAEFAASSTGDRLKLYAGPSSPPVTGVIKASPKDFQNSATPPRPASPKIVGPTKREGTDQRRLE